MNPGQTDRILARMMAAWFTMDVATREVWREHLAGMEFDAAYAAEIALEKGSPRRPSIAEFHAAYRAEFDHRRLRVLPPAPEDRDPAGQERIREMLERLRRRSEGETA